MQRGRGVLDACNRQSPGHLFSTKWGKAIHTHIHRERAPDSWHLATNRPAIAHRLCTILYGRGAQRLQKPIIIDLIIQI